MYIDKVEELTKKIYGVKITKNPLGNPVYEFTGTELAMFAKLIVEECLNLVDRGGEFVSRPKLVERIKEHFGVEE